MLTDIVDSPDSDYVLFEHRPIGSCGQGSRVSAGISVLVVRPAVLLITLMWQTQAYGQAPPGASGVYGYSTAFGK